MLPVALAIGPIATVHAEDASAVQVGLRDWNYRTIQSPGHADHRYGSRMAEFSLGKKQYAISYGACLDPSHGQSPAPIEGFIGMPVPSSANWYHSGFLFVNLNGKAVGNSPLNSITVSETETRGALDMVWHDPEASVRVRFLALPNDDKLMTEIAIEPSGTISSFTIMARCYPSFFTSWHKRVGARRIITPSVEVPQGKSQDLAPDSNWFLLYLDEVFDVARGEGDGPCALAFRADEVEKVSVSCGDYAVDTLIHVKPETRNLRLAFWDLTGETNAFARKTMPERAARAVEELRNLDFTPAVVREFNFDNARKLCERVMASESLRSLLGERATKFRDRMQEAAPLYEKNATKGRIKATELFLELSSQFQAFEWEAKLAELLEY